MTEIIDEKFELKLELRLLLDAAMRHREEKYDNDLTPTESDLIEANRPMWPMPIVAAEPVEQLGSYTSEPFWGTNIQAEGEKAASDGGPRRTAIERSLAG
jgi:hypothetical protein